MSIGENRAHFTHLRRMALRAQGEEARTLEWAIQHIQALEQMKSLVSGVLQSTIMKAIKEAPLCVSIRESGEDGWPVKGSG